MYYVSFPIAYTTQGLLDLNLKLEPSTGIATEWEASTDLLTYTFKLRKGVLFHNGREVDAAAVKWNYERIKDPAKSHEFTRSALLNLKQILTPTNTPWFANWSSPVRRSRPMWCSIPAT
jgi:peptide/nickel transport system substrate-binding protein